ncbi:MAG: hypothetical protein HKN91_02845 [Acidimicrobiia bacterium]|nr:hypothetical protein [Acidimicrobiia bacterium]
MSRLLELIAAERPDAVRVSPGGEILIEVDIAADLVDRAESLGIAILGMEGFLVDDDSNRVYPSLARLSNYSRPIDSDRHQFVRRTCADARATLQEWSEPPVAGYHMHREARGRHMLAIVLDD